MIIQFYNKNGLGCPGNLLTWKLMQGGDYNSFLSILEWIKVPDTKIQLLQIEKIENGVTDWDRFGRVLKEKFPNIKAVCIDEIVQYKNDTEEDLCTAARDFFLRMNFDYFEMKSAEITESQVENIKNSEQYDIHIPKGDY